MRLAYVFVALAIFVCIQGIVFIMIAVHVGGGEGVPEHIGHIKGGQQEEARPVDASDKIAKLQERIAVAMDTAAYARIGAVKARRVIPITSPSPKADEAATLAPSPATSTAAAPATTLETLPATTTEAPGEEKVTDEGAPSPVNPHVLPSGDINILDSLPGQLSRVQQEDPTNKELLTSREPPTVLRHLQQAAVVVLCHNRPNYLKTSLAAVADARLARDIKKYVSQDGDDPDTKAVAKSFADFEYLHHPQESNGVFQQESPRVRRVPGTAFVASHYKWVLDMLFIQRRHSHVILVEDDMIVTADFFEMFESLAPLLDLDPTLWCISSWNDNGFRELSLPRDRFFRTSYFPGLGWMLRRSLWMAELSASFPADNWDHWMRGSTVSKRRECVCPWLSRNRNIGAVGTTVDGDFYQQYIARVHFSDGTPVGKGYGDLRYLLNRNYFDMLQELVVQPKGNPSPGAYHHGQVDILPSLSTASFHSGGRYVYSYDSSSFPTASQQLSIRTSPRAHYRGILWFKYNNADIFLVHKRLSPFVPDRAAMHSGLVAVPARGAGVSCEVACSEYRGGEGMAWECAEDHFDYINDCQILTEHLGCPQGCTQGWGDEIPCMETSAIVGHQPMCLTTEMRPTCSTSHPKTRRLCPCVPQSDSHVPYGAAGVNYRVPLNDRRRFLGRSKVAQVPARTAGISCDEVCASHGGATGSYRCDVGSFDEVNACGALQQAFHCEVCTVSRGGDLPNFVSDPSDGQYKRCLTSFDPPVCDGSHAHTKRLCPCVAL